MFASFAVRTPASLVTDHAPTFGTFAVEFSVHAAEAAAAFVDLRPLRLSRVGIGLLVAGFTLQLVSNLIP